jgi:signal transduction histidine kinase
MKGFADLVLDEASERLHPEEQDYLRRITSATLQMDALVRDLLAYSGLGHASLPVESVALGPLVAEVLTDLKTELRDRRAQVTVEPGMPDLMGHEKMLRQVLSNLLSNAAKFVTAGTDPRIRIAAQTRGPWARLVVEDNGIGVAAEYQERIFQVFERLHRAEVYAGTGIGLAIVKRAVERMGGQVGVESELGKGSRFWIELPQAESTVRVPEPIAQASAGNLVKIDRRA